MKTVALYDFNWHGHHQMYLEVYAKILLRSGYKVVVFSQFPNIIIERCAKDLTQDQLTRLTGHIVSYPKSNGTYSTVLWQSYLNWKQVIADLITFEKFGNRVDFVFFLKIEDYVRGFVSNKWLASEFNWKWGGLFIHLDLIKAFNNKLFKNKLIRVRYLLKSLLNNFSIFNHDKCLFTATLQEDLVEVLSEKVKSPAMLLPELTNEITVQECSLSIKVKELAGGRKIVLLVGVLEGRKGIFSFLNCALRNKDKSWYFVCCGQLNHKWSLKHEINLIQEFVSKYRGDNLFTYFGDISDNEFHSLINTSDLIFNVYENFPSYSSNLLTKAALFSKPILVNQGGLLELRVNKFRIGEAVPSHDINAITRAIEKLLKSPVTVSYFQEYFNLNSEHSCKDLLSCLSTKL